MVVRQLPDPSAPAAPDPRKCHLLGPTALVVQGMMGILVIASLIIKRQLESQKRPWKIWIWDVGKQLVGQAVIHGLNILISNLVASAADDNPCSLYFLNVLVDTTIGVLVFYIALKTFTWLFANHLGLDGFVSGEYGNPPHLICWWKQLAPYLLSIIIMKLLVLLPLTLPWISALLLAMAYKLLGFLSPNIQVIFVLAAFPLAMTVLQFCIIDQVIKAGKTSDYQSLPTDVEAAPRFDSPRPARSPLLSPDLRHYGSTSSFGNDESDSALAELSRTSGSPSTKRDLRRSAAPSPDSEVVRIRTRVSDEWRREASRKLSPTTRTPRLSDPPVGLSVMR